MEAASPVVALTKTIHPALIITDAHHFPWTVIIEGRRYGQSRRIFGWLNIQVLPK
jgi:hypothetical protein